MAFKIKTLTLGVLFICCLRDTQAQVRILFDDTHAETSGTTADWTIDADLHNMTWSATGPYTCSSCTHSNPQQYPTPAQSLVTLSTPETYWEGALSNWGIDLVNQGFVVETLPYTGAITYGNSSNAQDLSNYKVFIVPEPNSRFTAAEKTALVQFVQNGGGLYMISDHNGSDRNNDGWDSPHIWDDFAGSTGNVFGIIADTVDVSPTVTTLPSLPGDSCLHGPLGTVTGIKYHEGTTFTIYPAVNPTVVGIAYNSGTSGDLGVLAGHAYYGRGKVAFIGDSSPLDDGTGNPASTLANSYTADVNGSHRILLVNTTVWLAASDSSGASGTLSITTNGSTTICPGQPITLTANGGSSYTWSPGGDTTASITVSPATNTTYSVSGIVNGSNQSRSITVNITPLPTPAFTATVTGMDVSFGNQSQNATTSTWNFGDGSAQVSSSTPLHIYTQNGTYTVLLITTNSCGSDTLSKKVVVGSNGISAIAQDDAVKVILLGSDQIKVSYPDSYDGDRSISVYSMTGQEVIKIMSDNGEGSRLVNIQNLLSGVYFLKAGSLVKKFIR
jgi:PKD repeat protein